MKLYRFGLHCDRWSTPRRMRMGIGIGIGVGVGVSVRRMYRIGRGQRGDAPSTFTAHVKL